MEIIGASSCLAYGQERRGPVLNSSIYTILRIQPSGASTVPIWIPVRVS